MAYFFWNLHENGPMELKQVDHAEVKILLEKWRDKFKITTEKSSR